MNKKRGRSEKKKDWLGNEYIQHYDAKGNKTGRSERKQDWLGNKHTQHYDSKGNKTGRSEKKEDWLGNKYTQKYNAKGEKSGRSEKKEGWLGDKYTQHYDSKGNKTDRSERKQDWLGNRYTERYGKAESSSTSRETRRASYNSDTSSSANRSYGPYGSSSPSSASTSAAPIIIGGVVITGVVIVGILMLLAIGVSIFNAEKPSQPVIQNAPVISSREGVRYAGAPSARKLANGDYALDITPQQQQAINDFIRGNPKLDLASFKRQNLTPEGLEYVLEEIEPYMKSGEMQFPFACWGDLNRDGLLDFVRVFVTKGTVNSWGWREWWVVAFHGSSDGVFRPNIVVKDRMGCFDGMFYDQAKNSVKYVCFPSGIGRFRWTGKRYEVEQLMGH